ncbi:MAG: energy-coupled thiamine transporter ThiT [Lachnospiraceae bacterium]|jgi:thiamine transporter|nr:energy-coupled thiamine transporter ThiT [Lachnospiraceae bacterium]
MSDLQERGKEKKRILKTKTLAFSALALALAFALSFVKLFSMPMGGSITLLSMLFVCLVGYWYGAKVGLIAAFAYGLLQLTINPFVISPPQLITDYILAFGALGLSGFFAGQKYGLVIGYLVGVTGRFFFSFLSGLLFFYMYAPEGMNAALYSFLYNGSYMGVEAAITVVIISLPPVAQALRRVKVLAVD